MSETITWQSVCSKCGKGGPSSIRSKGSGAPPFNPPSITGKCPASLDDKHRPKWVKKC